jgi:ribosomal protein S18 acetylase RimI-like enzyme
MALSFRAATRADVPVLVDMLADDHLGRSREQVTDPLPESYYAAFDALSNDPNNELIVATAGDRVVASLQITYTPSLSHRGSWRATLESVRTVSDLRGQGIGAQLVGHAIERAQQRGCRMVQLSTDKSRVDAQRFYQRLGFHATHEGMKLLLKS